MNGGNWIFDDNASITNNRSVYIQSNNNILIAAGSSPGAIQNNNIFEKRNSHGSTEIEPIINNNNQVSVRSGTLIIYDGTGSSTSRFELDGFTTITIAGTLDCDVNSRIGGRFTSATSTVIVDGTLNHQGEFRPGNTSSSGIISTLNINVNAGGTLNLFPTSIIQIEFNSQSNDVVNFSGPGNITLDGNVNLTFPNNSAPEGCNTFVTSTSDLSEAFTNSINPISDAFIDIVETTNAISLDVDTYYDYHTESTSFDMVALENPDTANLSSGHVSGIPLGFELNYFGEIKKRN